MTAADPAPPVTAADPAPPEGDLARPAADPAPPVTAADPAPTAANPAPPARPAPVALPPHETIRRIALELAASSQSGLAFCSNHFDAQRLHRVGELALDLMELVAAGPLPAYEPTVAAHGGYATPKVDVRGAVFDEAGRVLLVREKLDGGRWTLPGGWCDVLDTPTGAIEREIYEEAGLRVRARHLGAVIDREVWGHEPPFDVHVFKLLFVCEALEPVDTTYTSIETSGTGWFDVEDLPELSPSRVLPQQIRLLQAHWRRPGPAYVD